MPTSIKPVRVNHMNVVLRDFDESVEHLKRMFGAEFMVDIPQKELHAFLFELGRVIFEGFVPHEWLPNARYGPHYVGLEYQADMDEVRAAVSERAIGLVRDIGLALHTDPADCFGVSFEFYDGEFHERDMTELGGQSVRPLDYWRDEHPLGLTGQKAYTLAVSDLEGAVAFLESFVSGQRQYEAARPGLAAKAVGVKVADVTVEVLAPDGPGVLQDHLYRYGDGIRSTVFAVRDIEQVRRYFADRGIGAMEGTLPGSVMVSAEDNLGIIFEFAE